VGSIRKASDQEYWTAIQRIWTFEDLSSRWARLCRSAAKIAPSTYTFDTNGKWNRSQDEIFREIYGTVGFRASVSSVFFAICFALAEIERYEDGAFQYCVQSNVPDGKHALVGARVVESDEGVGDRTTDSDGATTLFNELLQRIISNKSLSIPQASFLEHCAWSTPDWTRLLEIGPWEADSRVEFIRSVLYESVASNLDKSNGDITSGALIGNFSKFEGIFKKTETAMRSQLPSGFLPKRILLVEGATEQILLPHFAECVAPDWKERAVLIIPAGGANQVVKRYPALRAKLRLPIDCLLDGDVSSQAQLVADQLMAGDRLYVLESGAIEEAFPRDQIVDLVNAYFDTSGVGLIFTPVTLQELNSATNQESMEKLWRKRNRGSFDKTGFAKVVAEMITTAGQIPAEIRNLISDLCAY
jgi:hypothetical protein